MKTRATVRYIVAISILLAGSVVMKSNANVITDQLVAYFPFNNNANDESGNGHDGTVNGATLTQDRFGNPGAAYDFNGSSDHINCGNIINGFSKFTVSAWVNIDSFTHAAYMGPWSQQPFENITPTTYGTYNMFTSPSTTSFGTSGQWPDGAWFESRVAHVLPFDEWHLITQTYDGVEIKQYDNDTLVNLTLSPGHSLSNSWDFMIGRAAGYPGDILQEAYFDGRIDDVRIYDRALSAQEVNTLYAIPEPASISLIGLFTGGIYFVRRFFLI